MPGPELLGMGHNPAVTMKRMAELETLYTRSPKSYDTRFSYSEIQWYHEVACRHRSFLLHLMPTNMNFFHTVHVWNMISKTSIQRINKQTNGRRQRRFMRVDLLYILAKAFLWEDPPFMSQETHSERPELLSRGLTVVQWTRNLIQFPWQPVLCFVFSKYHAESRPLSTVKSDQSARFVFNGFSSLPRSIWEAVAIFPGEFPACHLLSCMGPSNTH